MQKIMELMLDSIDTGTRTQLNVSILKDIMDTDPAYLLTRSLQ